MFLGKNPEVHAVLGETVACAVVSPHLYITVVLSMIADLVSPHPYVTVALCHSESRHLWCCPPLQQQHCGLGDFSNWVCHVRKVAVAETNPYIGLLAP